MLLEREDMQVDLDLAKLNSMGFIVGDDESKEQFERRVALCQDSREILNSLNLKNKVVKYSEFFQKEALVSQFDLDPSWLHILCSNTKLMPWEAASTWLYPIEKAFSYPILQFRQKVASKSQYLGYQFFEIFAHETIHAVRSNIKGDRYEETIAFQTSNKWYRQFLGPIFKSPSESILYVITWLMTILSSALFTTFESTFFFFLFITSGLAAISLSLFGLIRLLLCKRKFHKALAMVGKVFPGSSPIQIIIRLNDEEIDEFACEPLDKVVKYVHKSAIDSLKWRQILASYKVIT
ncbi:MAG: hypothetical protein P0S95_03705 [Rhabdochlamydiaceae bacterium]|nr:hypothetical protein [Candidatus Amphrikana amoebophyrae]